MKRQQKRWMCVLVGVLGVGLAGCKDDAAGNADTGASTGQAPADDGTNGNAEGTPPDTGADEGNCIAGGLGCSCAEGVCSGVLFCVEDTCVQGPEVEFDNGVPDVLAGLRVPLEVSADGETIEWTQTAGPEVEFLNNTGTNVEVNIPADAGDGELITLMVEVSLNGVTLSDTLDITIRPAVFSDVFPEVADVMQLGTTDGIAFNPAGMWVVSNEGFVSLMSPAVEDDKNPLPAGFVQRFELGGLPAGADFLDNDRLVIANTMLTELQALNTNSGNLTTYFDQVDGGGAVGAANVPLVLNNDGDVMLSTHIDGQILFHDTGDAEDDPPIPPSTIVLATGFGDNPNAMALGPEGEGMLYVGVLDAVLRIPYDNGKGGKVGTYLDLAGMCGEVDGLIFDEGGNMWVGCPDSNTLFVAQFAAGGIEESTTVSRTWADVGTGISRFANLSFGGDEFSDRALYWTNLDDGTVGSLPVGLRQD